jgi:thioredoxin 1
MAKIGLVVAIAVAGGLVLAGLPASEPAVRAGPIEARTARQVPRLVDLGATKCIPCKAMAPILEQLRVDFAGRLEVVFIDVWKDPDAASPFRIHIIPTQIFYAADGRELARHQGFISREEILAQWKALGVEL